MSGNEEWEVENILQHRVRDKTTQYHVRWKGFTGNQDIWEPKGNLKNAQNKIERV